MEIATGGNIDGLAWVDPEVQKLAGISDAELEKFRNPAPFVKPAKPVPQPGIDAPGPHQKYPPEVYKQMLATPDEAFWHAVTNEPPVKVNHTASKL